MRHSIDRVNPLDDNKHLDEGVISRADGRPEESSASDATSVGRERVRRALLDIGEVSDWLGTSHRHIRRLIAERRIPFIKVGHFIRFDEQEVSEWIDDCRVTPATPVSPASGGYHAN